MEGKETIYDENLRLHRTAKQMDMIREFIISRLLHDSYPQLDRDICVLLDIDYDEIMAEKGEKA